MGIVTVDGYGTDGTPRGPHRIHPGSVSWLVRRPDAAASAAAGLPLFRIAPVDEPSFTTDEPGIRAILAEARRLGVRLR